MFKKAFHTKPQSQVRSSDRRRLRTELLAEFPGATEEAVQELVPVKEGKDGGEVSVSKFIAHSGEQGTLYSVDGQPILWKDLDDCIYPTVYTLWKIPGMLPTIVTHGPVLQKLFDGADLMLPGVVVPVEGFGNFQYGDLAAVTVRGSLIPMAVGTMATSSDAIKENGYAMRGKAIHVLHTFGDQLWAHGDKSEPPEFLEYGDTSGSWSEVSYDPSAATSPATELLQSVESLSTDDGASIGSPKAVVQKPTPQKEDTIAVSQSTTAEMDHVLEEALFTVLKSRLPDDPKILPMTSSLLYSSYILPSRPLGTHLDIKHSSYKKVGKFLKAMEKRGLMKLKERGGETILMSVNRQHPQILDFAAPPKVAGDGSPTKDVSASTNGTDGATHASRNAPNGKTPGGAVMSIIKLYKASAKQERLFEEIGRSKDTLYTAADVRETINEYATSKKLVDPKNPRLVRMDPYIVDAILNKDEYNTIDYLERDAIVTRLMQKMQPFHELRAPGLEPEFRKGSPKSIQIIVEQRQGRKSVTRLSGMEAFLINPEDLAGHLKIRCASSTSVTPLPAKANTTPFYEVMVQGSKVKEVCAVLEKEYGVPFTGGNSRFVEILRR
ncbi:hypothetical protein PhCBS80983_g01088 [Powellomyces hirtus]|uniref:SUI1 domain-containing protein n=1 Tax=Powellomyces hirtus TaxID=109895 RepID=A0A507EDL3_9FUNG|nr:hypothetical protein PhCBS80983_g01088 [Powellomyces hirtus]